MMNIENIEQQFSERLANHQAFDLDADLTWKAIESELGEKKKRRGLLFFFPLGVGSLIGLLAIYSLFIRSEVNVNSQVNNDHDLSTISSYPYQEKKVLNITDAFPLAQVGQRNLVAIPGRFQYGIIQEICFFDSNQQLVEPRGNTAEGINKILAVSPKYSIVVLDKHSEKTKEKKERKEQVNDLIKTEISIQNRIQTIVPLLEKIPADYLKTPTAQVVLTIAVNTKAVERPKSQYQLEAAAMLFQSTNGLNTKNGGDYADLRKNSETPQVSWSIASNLWRTNPSGWLAGIGLEYQKTWVKFRYQKEEINNLLLENIPIHYLIDVNTQDTIARHIGNVNISQYEKRDVQHFNSFQTLSLPVRFGFIKPGSQQVTYGLVGGLHFQYHLKQSGRLLTENATIANFSDDSYFRRTGLSVQLQPVVILNSGAHWQLSCRPSLAFSLLNRVKTGMGIVQRPFTYGLSLGILRKL